jgi:integrase
MTGTNFSHGKSAFKRPCSLPVSEWPGADRRAWEEACRPGSRLKPGGVASYLAEVNRYIEVYLNQSRPVLLGSRPPTNALWISSTTGGRLTTKNLGILISKITLETIGVNVSPHLFRTAAASTAAAYGGNTPHLASALLNHIDPRVTEEHYNRASTLNAAAAYALIISELRDGKTS